VVLPGKLAAHAPDDAWHAAIGYIPFVPATISLKKSVTAIFKLKIEGK
jgi:hypothetical protein